MRERTGLRNVVVSSAKTAAAVIMLLALAQIGVSMASTNPPSDVPVISLSKFANAPYIAKEDGVHRTGGFEFRNIAIVAGGESEGDEPDWGNARLKYDTGWAGEDFPGTKVCTWNIYGGGEQIGSVRFSLTVMEKVSSRATTDISLTGMPDDVQVTCEGDRLDNPSGTYVITDISVSEDYSREDLTVVSFSFEWTGLTLPPVAECDVKLLAPSGEVVASTTPRMTGQGPSASFLVTEPDDMAEEPSSAEVSCTPL